MKKGRVTGIGGIFFKTEDPKKLKEWYGKHLGFPIEEHGVSFRWMVNSYSQLTKSCESVGRLF